MCGQENFHCIVLVFKRLLNQDIEYSLYLKTNTVVIPLLDHVQILLLSQKVNEWAITEHVKTPGFG